MNPRHMAGVILLATFVAGCTSTGTGIGEARSAGTGPSATFTWQAQGARTGTMTAQFSDGTAYTGPFFQVTSESRSDDFGPLWSGWGRSRRGGWGGGWGYWGPSQSFITHYSGKVLANLQGTDGHLRCRFTLIRPSSGMAGGGLGECQLPTKAKIDATFAPQ
ncbi:hypothetical protein [Novosphingobium sp. 18050]|uniref:hypothetical protein n=1 Tax=Novosphingobium sp. 18050 TaxID=2681398 RepID=UPI00135A197B|nr:hypothetical protein [Novosphingobium sp. 18050]